MLKVGDRVKWTDSTYEGTVSVLGEYQFSIHWDAAEEGSVLIYGYEEIVQRTPGKRTLVVIPPAPVEAPTLPPRPVDVTDYYIRVAANFEYRLSDVYESILRAIQAREEGNSGGLGWNLDWMKERIEATADRLATLDKPDGALEWTMLRDEIYQNHK